MSDVWTHYERRAAAFLQKGAVALETGDAESAAPLLAVAADNLYRAAKLAPPSTRNGLIARAEEVLAWLEAKDAARDAPDGSHAGGEESARQAWQVIQKTGVTLDAVAGLAEPKELLYNLVIRPMADPGGARRWRKQVGGGILLYGPPGTGKTLFAKAVAGELDAVFLNVVGSALLSKWVGDAEKNVDALFEEAGRHERCVLFIDEVEALLPVRGRGSTVMDRVVPSFLAAMDGISGRREGLLLLGATNRPDALDPAVLRRGRFQHQVYIGLPDVAARLQILRGCLNGVPLSPSLDLRKTAEKADGYSGADVAAVADAATTGAWDREEDSGRPVSLEPSDLEAALRAVKPSVSKAELKKYEKFRRG